MVARTLRFAVAIALCAVIAVGAADAASFTHSSQVKKIKAGVLLDTSGCTIADPDLRPLPYVFYIMNQRTDLKPAGWEFYNPYASAQVTNDIMARWNKTSTGYVYRLGDTVDKPMGCYWEVPISSMQPDELCEYDVLFLSGYHTLTFSNRDREKLRKFVDNGGVLWISYSVDNSAHTDIGNFFMDTVGFGNGVTPGSQAVVALQHRTHALLNRPFALSQNDIQNLGGFGAPGVVGTANVAVTAGTSAEKLFVPIVQRSGLPTIIAAQYGSGYVVISADNVGQAITEPVAGNVSNGRCPDLFVAAHPEDLKLAYNIVNWGSEHPTFRKNPRHTGASFEEAGVGLIDLWSFGAGVAADSLPPVILDDTVFWVDASKNDDYVLRAFDLTPVRSRNASGEPDDGVPDYSAGAMYDEIWHVNIGKPCSPPTAAYAPLGPNGEAVPSVFVVTREGDVLAYNALDYDKSTPPKPVPNLFQDPLQRLQPFNTNNNIPAPTYADGALYVGDGWGILHVHDFLTGAEWFHPNKATMNPPGLGLPLSPTVGYFYDPVTGATEQLVYIATHGDDSGGSPIDGTIRSYPIQVFNETLVKDKPGDWTDWKWRVRSINNCIDPVRFRLFWSPDFNTLNPVLPAVEAQVVPLPTLGKFELTTPTGDAAMQRALTDGASLIADYSLKYDPALQTTYRSITIHHPNSATPPGGSPGTGDFAGIIGTPAAGKDDALYFGTENGSIYAVSESGRSNAFTPLTVKWRWYLRDPKVQQVLNSGTFNALDSIVGSPVLIGDFVYFVVNDSNGQGYLLAFRADPVFSITLEQQIDPNHPNVVVRQDDNMINGLTGANAPAYTAVPFTDADKATPNTTFLVDYDTHKLTISNFRPRGQGYELTASEDLLVTYTPYNPQTGSTAAPPTITERHMAFAAGKHDQINNLAWFVKLETPNASGTGLAPLTAKSPPVAMGNVIYIGCNAGMMLAIDVASAAQKAKMNTVTGVSVAPWSPDYVWIKQVDASGNDVRSPIAGAHGMLAVSTNSGLSILYNPVTLIADGDRLVEVDGKGRPTWTCDSTNAFRSTYATLSSSTGTGKSSPVYGAANIPFNRPTVARRPYVGGMVVADTGNNRIVHIDRGGHAIWEIKDFAEWDPANPVLPPAAPMELSKPTDVTCWMTYDYSIPGDTNSQLLPIYHYLIADSGNRRVIEIMNRYDPAAGVNRNFVVQVSKDVVLKTDTGALVEGRSLQFLTARVSASNQNGPTEVIAAVAFENANKPDMAGLGGALVRIDWTTGVIQNGTINFLTYGPNNTPERLMNPTFYNRQRISSTEYADVIIDAHGIHVVDYIKGLPPIYRRYLNVDHVDMDETTGVPLVIPGMGEHKRPFLPSYAQYLPDGKILVTNKATGLVYDKNPVTNVFEQKAFYGEVFELKPAPGAANPAIPNAYVRSPGTSIWQQAGLRQPLSAEREVF